MINERIALIMLEGKTVADNNSPDPHYTKRLYQAMQNFAGATVRLCETGKLKKIEAYLKVATRLFKEGNETVKNAIVNVYLFTISYSLDKQVQLTETVKRILPSELLQEYHKLHYTSGL